MSDWIQNIWKKDRRRSGEDLLSEHFFFNLTKSEKEWLIKQAKEECTNASNIIRKSLKKYKEHIDNINMLH